MSCVSRIARELQVQINLPEKVRGYLYVLVLVGGPVMTYLVTQGVLGNAEMVLWTGLTSIVALIARFNLGTSPADVANDIAQHPPQ